MTYFELNKSVSMEIDFYHGSMTFYFEDEEGFPNEESVDVPLMSLSRIEAAMHRGEKDNLPRTVHKVFSK